MNGPTAGKKYIDTIDVDSPEYQRDQFRPAEVKQDVRQMSERKRVNEILKSQQFRDELEDIVVDKIKSSTPDRASILVLQQMSELILPQAKLRHGPVYGRGLSTITPIADLSKEDGVHLERGEKQLRNKLAACCRLMDQYRWNKSHATHISARLGHDPLTFLISPGDKPFSTVSASNLVALNEEGRTISGGRGVDEVTGVLHAAAYLARDDVRCVILLRSNAAVLLSSLGSDLMPLSRDAMTLGRVTSLDLNPGEDVADQLASAFQVSRKALLVRGVGALVVGESVEEAFIAARKLSGAMETQLKVGHVGLENLCLPSEELQRKLMASASKKQKRDELEFEALMRHLENAGHCTGYLFRESLFRKVERSDKVNAEVELPPTVVSLGLPDEDKPREKKSLSYAEYLNSPNNYKREEVELDSGTPYHKKITKWVQETSPSGNLIKIDSPNQFAPVGADSKELKDTMKKICREYYDENITAGPQSKILGGLTWDEAQKIKEKNTTSDTVIMVGAASRGIIQKGHQAQGNLYRTYYAPNPFSNVTEDDVDAYKSEIGMKTSGDSAHIVNYGGEDPDTLVPGPDGRLVSTEERIKQVKQQQQPVVDEVASDVGEEEAAKKKQTSPAQQTEGPKSAISSVPSHVIKGQLPTSPAKSLSSGEGTAPEATSGTEKSEFESSGTEEKKKKKKGFRMPSFSKKKEKK